MTVSRCLERVLRQGVKPAGTVVQDLEARGQRLSLGLVEITATDDEKPLGGRLAVLEVVLESLVHGNLAAIYLVCGHIEFVDLLAVSFADVQRSESDTLDGRDDFLHCIGHNDRHVHGLMLGRRLLDLNLSLKID